MMKRYIYIIGMALAAAASLLSGCVKQESTWAPSDIVFKPLIGHDTRAVESVHFPQDRSFNVWALGQGTGTYLDGEQISYGDEGWVSSKKWPREALEFEACWPVDLDVEYTAYNGLQLKDFDCRKGDVDILVAHGSGTGENDGVIILRFDHILSRVEFRMLHSLSETISVRLKKIEMIGLAGKGDYNIKKKDGWSVGAYDYSYVVYDAGEGEGIDITAGDAKYIGEEFYVIPQPCTASLEVTYDIRYNNANWLPQTEVIDNLETFWEPSKHYTYTVNLRMDKLTHTTGISSWNNQ